MPICDVFLDFLSFLQGGLKAKKTTVCPFFMFKLCCNPQVPLSIINKILKFKWSEIGLLGTQKYPFSPPHPLQIKMP